MKNHAVKKQNRRGGVQSCIESGEIRERHEESVGAGFSPLEPAEAGPYDQFFPTTIRSQSKGRYVIDP